MAKSTADFLSRLAQQGQTAAMKASGTIRLDIERDTGTDSWFVTLCPEVAEVSRQERQSDLVIRGHQALFDRLVRGQAQLYASLLRNEISVEGDMALLSGFGRLLPGPAGAHHPRAFDEEEGPGS